MMSLVPMCGWDWSRCIWLTQEQWLAVVVLVLLVVWVLVISSLHSARGG